MPIARRNGFSLPRGFPIPKKERQLSHVSFVHGHCDALNTVQWRQAGCYCFQKLTPETIDAHQTVQSVFLWYGCTEDGRRWVGKGQPDDIGRRKASPDIIQVVKRFSSNYPVELVGKLSSRKQPQSVGPSLVGTVHESSVKPRADLVQLKNKRKHSVSFIYVKIKIGQEFRTRSEISD